MMMGENSSYFLWNTGDPLVAYYEVLCSVACFYEEQSLTQILEKHHSFSIL